MKRFLPLFAAAAAAVPVLAQAQPGYDDPPPPPMLVEARRDRDATCLPADRTANLDAVIEASLGDSAPGVAVAVVCDGRLGYSAGFGRARLDWPRAPMSPSSSVFRLASVTKTMTAAVILKLAEEGRLSVDDRVSKHLPDFPRGDEITIYELLSHTAGLPEFSEDASLADHKTRDHTTAEMVAWIASLEPKSRFAPGTGWAYSNSAYVLLGAIIETLTGQSLQQAYAERLFRPLELTSMAFDFPGGEPLRYAGARDATRVLGYKRDRNAPSGFAPADPISMTLPGPAGSLRATAVDTARFGDALFGGRLLQPQSLTMMTTPGLLKDGRPNRWGMPEAWREGLKADYGLGVFIDAFEGRRRFWHAGDIDGFRTLMSHFPDQGVTVVILRNSESGDPKEAEIQAAVLAAMER